jgi:biotin carboxyl carrier protein
MSALSSVDSSVRWRSLVPTARRLDLEIDGELVTTEVTPSGDGWVFTASWHGHEDRRPLVTTKSLTTELIESADTISTISLEDAVCAIRRAYPRIPRPNDPLTGTLDSIVKAPLPGRVIKINVAPGEEVRDNETLIVLESMKMEHQIIARREAIVRVVSVVEGQTVERDAPLIELC